LARTGVNLGTHIISSLTTLIGGNVHEKHVVNVCAMNVYSSYTATNAVDLTRQNELITLGRTSSEWISYDFLDLRIIPTHYSVRSRYCYGKGCYHSLSWAFKGSVDGSSWQSLDEKDAVGTFSVACKTPLQFVRFRMTGPNSAGDNQLCLSGL
jgi:hypothetical protein